MSIEYMEELEHVNGAAAATIPSQFPSKSLSPHLARYSKNEAAGTWHRAGSVVWLAVHESIQFCDS